MCVKNSIKKTGRCICCLVDNDCIVTRASKYRHLRSVLADNGKGCILKQIHDFPWKVITRYTISSSK